MAQRAALRLMSKIARMYYEKGIQQSEIAHRLNLSQATISRFLKRAQKEKIVRITVSVPLGIFTSLEEDLQNKYNLKEAIVADCFQNSEDEILRSIGSAAAYYLETTIRNGEVLGISSWSATLLAAVDAMHQLNQIKDTSVVQILGSVGNPAAEVHASHLLKRLASLVNGKPYYLPAPAVSDSISTKESHLKDHFVNEALKMFEHVNLALVGIGSIEPSRLLASSGNIFSENELENLRQQGAVGDICLRFYNAEGKIVLSHLNHRVISMPLEQIKSIRRSVGIAGGKRKLAAIRGALHGKIINILITDHFTARQLISEN